MLVKFYTYTKRLNSTAIPSGDSVDINVKLLEPSSVENPVIIIKEGRSLAYNYCYIPSFGRYYWVTGKSVLDNNRVRYSLQVDVLASYKSSIASYSNLLKRRPARDNNVFDNEYMPKLTPTVVANKDISLGLNTSGTYLVFVSNSLKLENDINPTQVAYAMNENSLRNMCAELFNKSNYGQSGEVTQELIMDITQQTICNPLQYISRVLWFPFDIAGDDVDIMVGWIALSSASGPFYRVSTSSKTFSGTFRVHTNTTPWYLSDKTAQYYVYVPGCGVQSIPANLSNKTLSYAIYVDLMTGNTNAEIKDGSTIVASMTGNLGFSVPLSAVNWELPSPTVAIQRAVAGAYNGITSMVSTVSNMWQSGNEQGALASFLNWGTQGWLTPYIQDAIGVDTSGINMAELSSFSDDITRAVLQPTPSTIGGYSDRTFVKSMPNIRVGGFVNVPIITDFSSVCGNACHVIGTVSGSGYYQFACGDVPCTATVNERSQIASFLTNGFWYE